MQPCSVFALVSNCPQHRLVLLVDLCRFVNSWSNLMCLGQFSGNDFIFFKSVVIFAISFPWLLLFMLIRIFFKVWHYLENIWDSWQLLDETTFAGIKLFFYKSLKKFCLSVYVHFSVSVSFFVKNFPDKKFWKNAINQKIKKMQKIGNLQIGWKVNILHKILVQ